VAHDDGHRLLSERSIVEDLRLVEDRIDSEVGATLVAELLDDLMARYGGPDPDAPAASDFTAPHGVFLVAWLDGTPVACGGVRAHHDRSGELKRMYTRAAARRRGVGRAVLTELERRATALGYARLVLETGTKQPEAIAMYETQGYAPITAYGQYRDYPDSRCFAKDL
jgi:GNAT superfamily N-acetyltransferase